MDSGIDSTESSNGSIPEVGGVGAAEVMDAEAISALSTQTLKEEAVGLPLPYDAATPSKLSLGPSALRNLAAAAANGVVSEEFDKHKLSILETNADTSPTLSLLDTIPEGSRIQLHFAYTKGGEKEPLVAEPKETCVVETPATLSFGNVSASMLVSHGYEMQSQDFAILPYQNNDLTRKLNHLRIKMRHQHYQLISLKAKERKLRIAASLNNVETVEKLLKEGVNPKITDDKQRSPLHVAASKGYTEIVRLLLQYGADPNQRDTIGNTPLHLAACTSHISTVTLLLRAGTDVRQADNQGYSPLHLAQSKLKILQRDSNSSSQDIKKQVHQVIEMMQTYLECSGNLNEAELLTSFSQQLCLSDSRKDVESDLQQLLNSLHDLNLSKSKVP